MEVEEIVSTKTEDLEAMRSTLQPVLMQESLLRELPTPSLNVVHPASTKSFIVHGDVSVNENSRNDKFR